MKIWYDSKLKNLSRILRRNSTLGEVLLWKELKGKKLEYQFTRQKPIGNYIVDFYCPKKNLAIEVDGESHGYKDVMIKDHDKDEFLASIGISVLRFSESDVRKDISRVISNIEVKLSPP